MFCMGRGEKGSFIKKIPHGDGLCDVEYLPLNTVNLSKKQYIRDVPEDGVRIIPADNIIGDDLVIVIPFEAPLLEVHLNQYFNKVLEGTHKLKREAELKVAAAETKVRMSERGTREKFRDILADIRKMKMERPTPGFERSVERRVRPE